MTEDEFVLEVLGIARRLGYRIEHSRNGLQINFGHKKLHEGHLRRLFPDILRPRADIPRMFERVAPGRPCSHRPMREIMEIFRSTHLHF